MSSDSHENGEPVRPIKKEEKRSKLQGLQGEAKKVRWSDQVELAPIAKARKGGKSEKTWSPSLRKKKMGAQKG